MRTLGSQRLPEAILSLPLPAVLADGIRLSRRTLNHLAAVGALARPDHLPRPTVGQLVARRGFGVRSLLEVLLWMEFCGSRERARRAPRRTAGEEFRAMVHAVLGSRGAPIALAYLEFAGAPPTMECVGRRFGISRERVRQICSGLAGAVRSMHGPAIEAAIGALERTPASAEGFAAWASGHWGARPAPSLESVARMWSVLGRRMPIARVGDEPGLVRAEDAPVAAAVGRAARLDRVSTVDRVVERASRALGRAVSVRAARSVIGRMEGVRWLDDGHRWFFSAKSAWPSRVVTVIRKVMSVAPRVRLHELCAPLRRADERRGAAVVIPPRPVLAALCRHLPGCRVEGDVLIAEGAPRPESALCGVELILARVLLAHRSGVSYRELKRSCLEAGVNRHAFVNCLAFSPIVTRLAPMVYGPVGSRVDRAAVRSLVESGAPERVVRGHGRTGRGGVWILYRLSRRAAASGIVTIPAAVRGTVGQGAYALDRDGAAGRLVIAGRVCCGWGPTIRASGGVAGAGLLLLFDPARRRAEVRVGPLRGLRAVARGKVA